MEDKDKADNGGAGENWTFVDKRESAAPEDDVVVIEEDPAPTRAYVQEPNVTSSDKDVKEKEPKDKEAHFPCSAYGSREELCDDEYYAAGDKHRSYIHKRNGKLSGTLNMILLGAIATTACLALGHVWGTTDDCSPEMSSSLSELLFAMQELQHENFVLKSKVQRLEEEAAAALAERQSDLRSDERPPEGEDYEPFGDDLVVKESVGVEETARCICDGVVVAALSFEGKAPRNETTSPKEEKDESSPPLVEAGSQIRISKRSAPPELKPRADDGPHANDSLGKYDPNRQHRKRFQAKEPKKKYFSDKHDRKAIDERRQNAKNQEKRLKYEEKKKAFENSNEEYKKGFENFEKERSSSKRTVERNEKNGWREKYAIKKKHRSHDAEFEPDNNKKRQKKQKKYYVDQY